MDSAVLQEWLDKNGKEPAEEVVEEYGTRYTYAIVSKVAYLLGVPERIFENEHEPPKMDEFRILEMNKNARIIRNLCMLRAKIERNFGAINKEITNHYKALYSLPELVPQDAISALAADGIQVFGKRNIQLAQHIVELNGLINDRINNVKSIFPVWINWDYLKDLFIMPNGLTVPGTKAAAEEYYANREHYPYQIYLNWNASENDGNIFFNDKKFVTLLYEKNLDQFTELSRVSDVDSSTKQTLNDFIHRAGKISIYVDCENADVFSLYSALKSLTDEASAKIERIVLFDDIHTTEAWQSLADYTRIPIEYQEIKRVKENKSLVDIRLVTCVCREFYQEHTDSFILVSSDSDYWGLISDMPDAKFLVMVEHEKCGPDLKEALTEHKIFFCYTDDFYSGDEMDDLKEKLLLSKIQKELDDRMLDIHGVLEEMLLSLRISMCESEKKQFLDRYLRNKVRLEFDGETYRLALKK